MTRALSLHYLCALELDPVALVHTAADAGFQHVCIFTQAATGVDFQSPIIGPDNVRNVQQAMSDRSVSAYNIEIFWLGADTRATDFRRGLDVGSSLGGTRATAIITPDGAERAPELFADFAEVAGEFGIAAGLEFMAFSPISTLDDARRVVEAAGHPNGSIVIDMLHLMRNGGSAADVAELKPDLVGYVQLCDGPLTAPPDPWEEAIANRGVPGEGEFPLRDVIASIPGNRTLALEVPLHRLRDQGVNALSRAKLLMDATQRLVS